MGLSIDPPKHELQVRPAFFSRLSSGVMTFWIAEDEDGFQCGDRVRILEFNEQKINSTSKAPKGYTGRDLEFVIGFVHSQGSGKSVLSLLPLAYAPALEAL